MKRVLKDLEMRVGRLEKQAVRYKDNPLRPVQIEESSWLDKVLNRTFPQRLEKEMMRLGFKNVNVRFKINRSGVGGKGVIFFMYDGKPYEFPLVTDEDARIYFSNPTRGKSVGRLVPTLFHSDKISELRIDLAQILSFL
jgi:hypothetical protein